MKWAKDPLKGLATPGEAAVMLDVTLQTIRQYARRGLLHPFETRAGCLYPIAELKIFHPPRAGRPRKNDAHAPFNPQCERDVYDRRPKTQGAEQTA